ncbi:MAG: hypothetical protein MR425_08625 [Lachnospiraceae bacterium]|nr:hypothetical protein [Lachnospiraceae bacterium]
MEKNDANVTKPKKDTSKLRIVFSAMILFVLFIAEVYLMIHSSDYFVGLITVTVLMIAVLYVLIISIVQVNFRREQMQDEVFEDIFRAEKATYLLLRKNYDEFNERLTEIEDNLKIPTEEIIEAQKAVAKVSINRNKENTDALMNSNDKLLEKIFTFETLLTQNNDKMIEQQKMVAEQANAELLKQQQETLARLKELELSIRNEILQSVNRISSIQPQVVMTAPQMQVSPQPQEPAALAEDTEEPATLADAEENIGMLDDIDSGLTGMEETESLGDFAEEPELGFDEIDNLGLEDEAAVEDLSVEAEPEMVEEPAGEPAEIPVEEVAEAIEVPVEEPAEAPVEEVPEVTEAPVEEPVVETPVEEIPPMPDLSDPNKMMTPDDIAALLANVGAAEPEAAAEPAVEEPVTEPAEEPVEEIPLEEEVIEEKPPMPDLSDPNRMMTPDDIAALLANM